MNAEILEEDDDGGEKEMTKGQKFRQWMSNWCDIWFHQPRY